MKVFIYRVVAAVIYSFYNILTTTRKGVPLLDLPTPRFSENYIKIKINLNFYFHTSLWSLKRFYEGL